MASIREKGPYQFHAPIPRSNPQQRLARKKQNFPYKEGSASLGGLRSHAAATPYL